MTEMICSFRLLIWPLLKSLIILVRHKKKGVANELCRLYEDDESSFVEPFLEKYHSKCDLPESPDDLLDYNFKN